MISDEREMELDQYYWEQSNDEDTREWRNDLTLEEMELVNKWDQRLSKGLSKLYEEVIKTENVKKENNLHEKKTIEIQNEKQEVIAKDLKQSGFSSEKKIIKKIEDLNHITERQNTIKDIKESFMTQSYRNSNPEAQETINDIGKELRAQEISRVNEAVVMER